MCYPRNYKNALELIKQGADVSGKLVKLMKHLAEVEMNKDIEKLLKLADLLISLGENVTDEVLFRCMESHRMAEFLLGNGGDASITRKNNETLIMNIIKDGYQNADKKRKTIKFFMNNGCDVCAVDNDGKTALIHAVFEGYRFAYPLLNAKNGCNINARDNTGKTALIYDMLEDGYGCEYLIKKGADTTIKDNENHDALWYAKAKNMTDAVKYIEKHRYPE